MAILIGAGIGAVFGYAAGRALSGLDKATSGREYSWFKLNVAMPAPVVGIVGAMGASIGLGVNVLFGGPADPADARRDEVRAAVEECMVSAQTAQDLTVTRDGQTLRIVCPAPR